MANNYDHLQGWYEDNAAVEAAMTHMPFPVFGDIHHVIKDTGRGKKALLYTYVQKCLGTFPVQVQEIGDCPSFMLAHILNTLKAVQAIQTGREIFDMTMLTSTEDVYAGSRVLIGKGVLGSGDGSVGAWVSRYVTEFGTLCRRKYGDIDLSEYSGSRAKQWGQPNAGPPRILLPFAKEHLIKTTSQVNSYEEARDLLCNGYLVGVCSNRGFTSQRDKDGFAQPSGSWSHAMGVLAVDDEYKRPGVLIQNSWPITWITGPKRWEQPDGSFWCDADVFDGMCKQGDTFAYSNFVGFPIQKLKTRWV